MDCNTITWNLTYNFHLIPQHHLNLEATLWCVCSWVFPITIFYSGGERKVPGDILSVGIYNNNSSEMFFITNRA